MQTVKIQSIDNTIFSMVFLGDKKLERVREVTFNQSVEMVPCFTFETIGLPDIEIDNADIRFRFTPKTIEEAVKVLIHSFDTDKTLYDAFVASIESAIYDDGTVYDISDQHRLAAVIADRIIGGNNDKV